MKWACCTISGLPGWTYSVLSLNTKIASGRRSRIARIARIDALQQCFTFVTNAWSLISRSFHQPYNPEKIAVT
jgi:hypothetical protein